jgi:hypothetical protein
VSAAASGRTIFDRRETVILEEPLFRRARAVKTRNRHGSLLLTGFIAACLLQISKIATILRQTAGLVVRFQHSHSIATGTFANVGIKGPSANY